MEELNYHVDFGQFYVNLTRKQKKYLAVRSVIDRILAALALIVLSPLFLVVSVAQKISAPDEPIFFLQKRVGRGAHCFNIIKFRTMKSSAPKNVATGDLESPEKFSFHQRVFGSSLSTIMLTVPIPRIMTLLRS